MIGKIQESFVYVFVVSNSFFVDDLHTRNVPTNACMVIFCFIILIYNPIIRRQVVPYKIDFLRVHLDCELS